MRPLSSHEFKFVEDQLRNTPPSINHWSIFLIARAKLIQLFISEGKSTEEIRKTLSLGDGQIESILTCTLSQPFKPNTLELLQFSQCVGTELVKGVLTTEEASHQLAEHLTIITLSCSKTGVFFYTDYKKFAYHLLPDTFVVTERRIPHGIEKDRVIETVQRYVDTFHKNQQQITSVEQLALYLNDQLAKEQSNTNQSL